MPFALAAESRETEINQLNHVCTFLNKNIIKLDISMRNSLRMQIIECLCNLLKEPPANTLFDLTIGTLLLNILMQTSALYEICYNAYIFGSFY